jgi:predicted NBD/HSP70 family sugar kinase
VRQAGSLSKADIARATGLSAQSATNIVNRLQTTGLLRAGDSVRGKVGQPSVPYTIDPEGAFSIGIKVGRQSAEIAVMGFDYQIRSYQRISYDYPVFNEVRQQIIGATKQMIAALPQKHAHRLLGIGLAIPDALESWECTIGAPTGSMADWASSDLRADLAAAFGLPVLRMNDASAACLAALKLGRATTARAFLYLYVGTFAGGGLAINGRVYEGLSGNAGALGSMPMRVLRGGEMGQQLIGAASLHDLEESAAQAGVNPQEFYAEAPPSAAAQACFTAWMNRAAPALAFTFVAGQAILDLDTMVLDASLSDRMRAQLVQAVRAALPGHDTRGLKPFDIVAGDIGVRARSLGSALLPFQAVTEYELM